MTVARVYLARVYKSAIGSACGVQLWMQERARRSGVARGGAASCILTARRHDVSAIGTEAPTSEEIYRGDTWARDDNCLELGRRATFEFFSLPLNLYPIVSRSHIQRHKNHFEIDGSTHEQNFIKATRGSKIKLKVSEIKVEYIS